MKTLIPLNEQQQKLVADHYEDAKQIGVSFKSSVLYDDEKENIAVRALIRAAQHYDSKRNVKFSTYLYRAVINSLLSHKRINKGEGKYQSQQKRIPKNQVLLESTIQARSQEQGKEETIASLFAEPSQSMTRELEHNEILAQISLYLTERERFVFESMMQPDVTYEMIAEKLDISRQRVHQIHVRIQRTIKKLIREGVIQWTPIL